MNLSIDTCRHVHCAVFRNDDRLQLLTATSASHFRERWAIRSRKRSGGIFLTIGTQRNLGLADFGDFDEDRQGEQSAVNRHVPNAVLRHYHLQAGFS